MHSWGGKPTFDVGTNHWTIQPAVNYTYVTPFGLEFSGSTQVNFNTQNHATNYTSGVDLQQDFGIGQHVGDWVLGAGGYFYTQLSDDKGPGATDGNRSRVFAIGPAIGFVAPQKKLPIVYLHAYKEFAARNRPEGYQIALRINAAF